MFIYSLRAKTLKLFGVICVALVGVIMLAAFVPDYIAASADMGSKDINYSKVKDNEGSHHSYKVGCYPCFRDVESEMSRNAKITL